MPILNCHLNHYFDVTIILIQSYFYCLPTAAAITPAIRDFTICLNKVCDLSGNDLQISSNIYENDSDSESSYISDMCEHSCVEDKHLLVQSENYAGR